MAKYRLATPGPVAVPERVNAAMSRPLLHHRGEPFLKLFREVRAGLREVFQTEQEVLVLAGTGTAAMEAAIANTLSPGEQALVVRGGRFGARWAEICHAFSVDAVSIDVEWGRAVEPERLRECFERHPDARALLVQASETSTGVFHPIEELARITRERDERLLVVDGISAVGVHELPMDAWGIDVLISGSQKSWLLPPGLSFVALSEQARRALDRCSQPRYYLDLRKQLESQARNQTPFSAPVAMITGLRESLEILREQGLATALRRHEIRARMARAAVRALELELLVSDSPSFACTAVRVPEGLDVEQLLQRLEQRYGVILAGGQGPLAGRIFRIGHMGDLDELDLVAVIAALELALLDLGYPAKLGEGTRAASEVLRESGLGLAR